MRVLVTRPEPDASATAGRLAALGHAVDVAPMMTTVFAPEPAGLAPPSAFLFTSRNAVRALARWPSARAWRALPVCVVGGATAALARAAGYTDVRVAGGNAAALADLARADLAGCKGTILYPAAHDRAADLAAMLDGFAVETVEAYRAVAATGIERGIADLIRAGAIEGATFFSPRSASIFVDLIGQARLRDGLRGCRLFALSEAVARPLAALPAAGTSIAARPDEESLFALLPPAP
jgi:uroporphyrinogen-III synthase